MVCSIKKYPAVLEGFCDADWNTLSGDSCSTTGYVFTLCGGAVCWRSKKQTIIANSTMEAELISLASCSEEANWLRDLLFQISYFEKPFLLFLFIVIASLQLVEFKTVITMVNPDL